MLIPNPSPASRRRSLSLVRSNRLARRGLAPREVSPPVRAELVARVRAEIAAGTYDTPDRWATALRRLADRLA